MSSFLGTGVALVTPFDHDGNVDVQALEKLVEFQIENAVEYLVVLGTTAESATLTKEEKELVKQTIVNANKGRLPVVLGIGGNSTAAVIQEIKETDLSPYQAILSVSPCYNKPSQEGIYQHFKAIAEACPIDIILYNVPGRTSSNVSPKTVVRLSKISNIVGIKEAKGDMDQALKLIKSLPSDFLVISGDDMLALPITLAGGSGVISVIGQAFPSEFSHMIRLGLLEESKKSFRMHYKIQDSIDLIFSEGNPVGVKALLEILGLSSSTVRLPLVEATSGLKNELRQFVEAFYVAS
ncbi:4-hydroxy-tetrahydrodipicolinate synthase [Wenyingzhuangia sp. 2_MG-2023]|uniref:4-hydroxy-tetrahydrodipicolinate synthase n=1 Tax=Wenyingzhuangia sp. 2_MG-2023 TaxID=3062639 RepID=UPI0026E3FA13|nr:4-hydroxy-tetrahydrodipicolinate synthase [Wenyingzhuangia sp. 2_MG-2023]MDO6736951.1 4-hydroxy-tetrahydrodipicolinate synthase [Wenyingzhuangia sp. 2_MG-2023]MDO6801879.1 4-hydroxy-tetrahydrodipicolinate synthase [Wenyingzhuangia sp. 1_MG-2023]